MAQKRKSDESAQYTVDCALLGEIKARQGKSKVYCMRTVGKDEASITGIISILKLISEELGLSVGGEEADGVDLQDRVVMYHGDYLTMQKIGRAHV